MLAEGGVVEELTGSSITYRIAVGPHKGRPVHRLQSLQETINSTLRLLNSEEHF